ncbi:50S ribosomal protein L19 [candidate division WOR-1 bacterium RIFOXYC2_FULL_37_10]|uniref:Large ribosomal subunit protein bL19 n=1 Tax=candidate division WOR-1 bacterium RIFOXYB2_FULL_37_13 TaxID=1802579 RepID=A0A1F4SDT3_UNCSA|nr:MAG: 50S ribosomal protein L19 [candidate division WOR-1 bacterium RIFOXYA2_FULL_37_7]OGC18557.1 MAG: 50S ribosomal protein L19 [candidate division WOR-1 bacterium RIFOXYB2_FULL_37_13]OGC36875.1 MAG: 50S ribosomal protein L19 [candidate division WOR-1 bacterium RIFOXYC2_FULL_37_10]
MSIIEEIEKKQINEKVALFNVGDTVKVLSKIVEGNKERLQAFEGIVIKRKGGSNRATFTVRKLVQGIGVERIFPLHSPKIDQIQIMKKGRARRAKLYYLRNKIGSAATKVKEEIKKV